MTAVCAPFCPRCGFDLIADQPVIINDFSMLGQGYPLCFKGKPLKLTYHEADICWALLKAYPMLVKYDTLLDRIDSDGMPNTLNVFVCRIRQKFKEWGLPESIGTQRSSGYIWMAKGDRDEVVKTAA